MSESYEEMYGSSLVYLVMDMRGGGGWEGEVEEPLSLRVNRCLIKHYYNQIERPYMF